MRQIIVGVAVAALAIMALTACGSATKTKTVTVASKPQTTTPKADPATAGVKSCSQITPDTMTCSPNSGEACPTGYAIDPSVHGDANCWYDPSNDMYGDSTDTGSTDTEGTGDTDIGTEPPSTPDVKSAAPGKWLNLSTLHAKIAHVSIVHEMSSDMGVKNAKGKFVVVSLSVTNHSDSPQRFDGIGGDQTALVLANQKQYSEDFDVGNGIDQNSFTWNSDDIQPDQTVTHDVIFDVPAHAVVSGGNLAVLNFGEGLSDDVSQIGSIDLGNLA